MQSRTLLAAVWFGLSLTACAGPAEIVPTQSASSTIPPTATPAPTLTRTATPIVMPTAEPSATSTPEAYATEYWATATAVVQALVRMVAPRRQAEYRSPDEAWRAEVLIYDCTALGGLDLQAYEQLTLTRVSDSQGYVVDDQLQNCGGLGAYGLGGLFWSSNSRYFYYTNARESAPDGVCWYWERPLYRVDVATHAVELVGGGPFSPDQSRLATWRDTDLVIWDVNAAEIARFPMTVPGAKPGPMAWSPDSQSLAYLLTTSDCYPFGTSTVMHIDLATGEQRPLVEQTPALIYLAWDRPNHIRFTDEANQAWRYNLLTETLEPDP